MELSPSSLKAIVAHLAHMRAAYGDVLREAELVEPTGEYFPDEFSMTPEGVAAFLERMSTYAPLSTDLDVGVAFVEPEGEAKSGGGCGSGACSTDGGKPGAADLAPAVETDEGYAAVVSVTDVGEPALLGASLARSIGRIVLFEADEDVPPQDAAALSELTAVASGLGLLLLNGACVYKKSCGGMRRHQGTALSVEELALALALFIRVTDTKAGRVKKHLEVTQREAFDAALAWVDERPNLVAALERSPETLEDGVLPPEEKRGLLSRLFGGRREDDVPEIVPVRARERSDAEKRRLAEMKALVDEALQEP